MFPVHVYNARAQTSNVSSEYEIQPSHSEYEEESPLKQYRQKIELNTIGIVENKHTLFILMTSVAWQAMVRL